MRTIDRIHPTSKPLHLILCLLVCGAIMSCATTQQPAEPKVERVPMKFDYSPKTLDQTGSADIVMALLNPKYGSYNYTGNVFDFYRTSMGNDFEELLLAKGFTVRGPFVQYGDMLYNDKINSDLILEVDIDFNFTNLHRQRKRIVEGPSFAETLLDANARASVYYTYSGSGSFSSTLVLTALTTRFNEKLWKKSISLPEVPLDYIGALKWSSSQVDFFDEVNQDNIVYNAFATALMKQYDDIFELLEKQVDVEEFHDVKAEAHIVDRKEEEN